MAEAPFTPPDMPERQQLPGELTVREVPLGDGLISSCNPALGDVDGDGRDEIAIPITQGEDDSVRLYRADGSLAWANPDVRFYHAYYNDPKPMPVAHMWYRSRHRHLLTEIVDFDGDGKPEVLVGDGPIYVLNVADGQVKTTIDLGGSVPLWTVVQFRDGRRELVATVDGGSADSSAVVGAGPDGRPKWRVPTPGREFCDCIRWGDLLGDGNPVVGFSISDAKQFRIMDCHTRSYWLKSVPEAFGEDEHVDDFVIGQILPPGETEGAQIAVAPGPALVDCRGNILWTRRDLLSHSQSIRVADFAPDVPGNQIYTVEKNSRRACLLSCRGEPLWFYNSFSQPVRGSGAGIILTTASAVVDWAPNGGPAVFQTELGSIGSQAAKTDGPVTLYLHVIDGSGEPLAIVPYQDAPARGFIGAMCAKPGRLSDSAFTDVAVITHNSNRLLIYSLQ